jgi:hypothetical protein
MQAVDRAAAGAEPAVSQAGHRRYGAAMEFTGAG